MNRIRMILVIALAIGTASQTGLANTMMETPMLLESVQNGELEPVIERIPAQPQVVTFDGEFKTGKHGGELRVLMGKQKDIRQLVIYGYARLVGYTPELELQADILESLDVVENRIFTLHLRKGHRWSDGHPFTSEDFRYYWEDMANNAELSKGGPAPELLIDGEGPTVEFPDLHTVRYSWSQPNPYFLPALAGARPFYIYKPAHYLRQFHKNYQSEDRIAELIKQYKARNWKAMHVKLDRPYKATNPDLPTLQPWMNTTYPPSERFIFKRNPFYHRIDSNGQQLPYIDSIAVNIASGKLIPAKTGAGESDLQARYLRMDNYTFLRQAALRNNFHVRLWKTSRGAHIALFPNLNTNDETLRGLMREQRFRRALSLAIHRHEINQVVYFGLVLESNNTVLPESPLFRPGYQKASTEFDLVRANALLDELGLTERDDRGVRLMPDGRPLEILIQTAGESTEQTDVLELIGDSWLKAGIKLYSVPSTREVFRNRIFSGEAVMSIWSGLANALPTADTSPADLAPTTQYQYQWPKWGQYYESAGKAGEKPENSAVNELSKLNGQWRRATSKTEREKIWHQMLEIHSEQMFTIGIISGILHPVVVDNNLHNVPVNGFYDIRPTAYFGVYKPDTFWFDEERR